VLLPAGNALVQMMNDSLDVGIVTVKPIRHRSEALMWLLPFIGFAVPVLKERTRAAEAGAA
jgi:hypothetical protein